MILGGGFTVLFMRQSGEMCKPFLYSVCYFTKRILNGDMRERRGRASRNCALAFLCGTALVLLSVPNARSQAVTGLDATRVASGLSSPLFATAPPGDYNRLFIVQQGGVIRILDLTTSPPSLKATPFLNISSILQSGGEQGLLGLAFDPNYLTLGHPGKGKFYVYIT